MHLNLTPIHVLTAVTVTLLLSACGKHDVRPDCGAQLCQIQKLEGYDEVLQYTNTNTIEYNAVGNPVLRLRSDVGTGSENESYRYDNKNRLTDQILHYNTKEQYGDVFWEWHRFKYDNRNRIYLDTFYSIGIIGDHPLPLPVHSPVVEYLIIHFEYDHKDRIIKETANYSDGRPWYVRLYTYDHRQNLVKKIAFSPSSGYADTTYYASYDNKVNYLRTNKVWQFLNRDYSENNPIAAVSYNKYGLPLQFRPNSKTGGRTHFLDVTYSNLDITYQCK
ncbi:hypothetical protein L3C95_22815 [Chitinophaga filiformis]|uniref:hypothetical protein n=1 Tax=Chitinophaga filiformis TaxID=104663 RepID=UPI001F33FCD6|nr:hypothetical protein [Chitinophaga filiformis]MCF6405748.1 hypothetical protein [Chitinophaga filiformis]